MAKLTNDKISFEVDLKAQKAQAEIHRLTKATELLRKQNTEYRKEISRLAATEGDHSIEIKRLNETIKSNTREIEANKRAMETERQKLDLSTMSAAQLGKELKRLKRELNNTAKAIDPERYKTLEKEVRRTEKAFAAAQISTRGFKASFLSLDKIATTIKGFFMGIGLAITTQVIGTFKRAVSIIIEFEKANSQLAAILGTNQAGIKELTKEARRLGATTSYTAAQVTSLQIELAKLGFGQDQIAAMEADVLKFAKAVGTDLASAAAFAGASMRIFNIDAKDSGEMLATLAIGTTKSALDFNYLQSAMSTIGPVAYAFGFSIQETVALLGTLANAGFDASSAATATRNILLNLADSSGKLAQTLGAPVKNLDELVAGLKQLNSDGVDLNAALELTDKRSVAVFSTFLNNIDTLSELRDGVTGVTGSFNAMSDEMGYNVQGSLNILASTAEGVILKFYESRGVLKSLVDAVTLVVEWIGKGIDVLQRFSGVIKVLLSGLIAYRVALLALIPVKKLYNTYTALSAKSTIAETAAIKAQTLVHKLHRASLLAVSLAKALLTGNIKKARLAMHLFNITVKANPIGLLLSVIAAAVSAFGLFKKEAEEAADAQKAWSDAQKDAAAQYGQTKSKIDSLLLVAKNERISLDRRKQAIAELNKIIPGYNAKLDETTGKYEANKKALDDYLVSMEKEMRWKASESKLQELVTAAEDARFKKDETIETETANFWSAEKKMSGYSRRYNAKQGKNIRQFRKTTDMQESLDKMDAAEAAYTAAQDAVDKFRDWMDKGLSDGSLLAPSTEENIVKTVEAPVVEGAQSAEEKARKILERLSAPIDAAHNKRLRSIEASADDRPAIDQAIAKAREEISYCDELLVALGNLRAETDAANIDLLNAITKREDELEAQIQKSQKAINKAMTQDAAENHSRRLAAAQTYYDQQRQIVDREVLGQKRSEEGAELYLLALDRNTHESRLKELKRYYEEVNTADYISAEDKRKTLEKVSVDIRKAQSDILTDTGKMQEKLREYSTNTEGLDYKAKEYRRQRDAINEVYDALIRLANLEGGDVAALEKERQRRLGGVDYSEYSENYNRRQNLGLTTWGEDQKAEKDALKNAFDNGLMTETEYQQALFGIKTKWVGKYVDYYTSAMSSMFSAIQDAEIARSDAKYDVLIQQAKNNGEDTAALEEEKENKKLEIQKKYADVDFAIKVSQIVADTAVGVIKTFAQFGYTPWGIAAAALMTATGVAQMVTAKAERDKIKNMQPGKTASGSGSSPATAQRVLSGYSDGGYTGDGDRYEVAGVVHRGEYVVPKPIMDNPRVVDAVGTIEAIRRNKILGSGIPVATPSAGYADGGFTSTAPVFDTSELAASVNELRDGLKNLRAYVVYKDIEKASDTIDRARAPFTRNK